MPARGPRNASQPGIYALSLETKMMKNTWLAFGFIVGLAGGVPLSAFALTIPFTEDFATGVSNWEDSVNNPLVAVGAGGPDGGSYATTTFNYFGFSSPFGGGPVIFRGSDSDDASGDAFVGDWIAGGVSLLTVSVRHNAPTALTFFARVASAFNFPGAVIAGTQAVAPDTWTDLTFIIDPANPLCTGESVSCATAFAGVGNLQFGTDAPAALTALDFAYAIDLDKVSITAVPEPALALLLLGILGLVGAERRWAH